MPMITLHLKEAQIRSEVSGILTSGMVGVEVELVCDESWDGLSKTLVCRAGDTTKTVLVKNNRAVAAHETIVAGKWLELGVEGRNYDGSVVIPTLWERCCIVLPGVDAEAGLTVDPTMPIWAQLQSRVEELAIPPVPTEIGAIPAPAAAKVGQHFQVAAVDAHGAVTAVEAVDVPKMDIDTTLTKEDAAADAKAVGDALMEKISIPSAAAVGQALAVISTNESGKPTGWGCVNLPNGVPDCAASDDGKFLRVIGGVAAWSTIPSAEEGSF